MRTRNNIVSHLIHFLFVCLFTHICNVVYSLNNKLLLTGLQEKTEQVRLQSDTQKSYYQLRSSIHTFLYIAVH